MTLSRQAFKLVPSLPDAGDGCLMLAESVPSGVESSAKTEDRSRRDLPFDIYAFKIPRG